MIDRLFLATVTVCVLIAGVLAIGSGLIDGALKAPARVVAIELDSVMVTAKRLAPPAKIAAVPRAEPAAQRAE
ncbi:MAG: hypothetical protein ABI702_05455 [Burkholderiales bacterium]